MNKNKNITYVDRKITKTNTRKDNWKLHNSAMTTVNKFNHFVTLKQSVYTM